ncbi:hypothetical protein GCM10009779_70200 [Polymorphospora rubra]|uniref:Uncharacterized protein n=1 Tax=Polymorphospora rubra TaxID=338584 RepID=A0A810N6M6_9ACTN|nr:hypothetical protein Prubr_64420 [Polymorphospora rubra]
MTWIERTYHRRRGRPTPTPVTGRGHGPRRGAGRRRPARPGAPPDATLVINNVPCDDPNLPLVCEKILAKILPPAATVSQACGAMARVMWARQARRSRTW